MKFHTLSKPRRRGISTLWLILLLPCLVISICLVIEISNLWIARAELETAAEAAALAAVKEWGDAGGGDTLVPRQFGEAFGEANEIRQTAVSFDNSLNYDNSSVPNQNDTCDGELVFGAITSTPADAPNHVFNANVAPSCTPGSVLIDATQSSSLQEQNSWGINFKANPTNPNLQIAEISINLRAGSDPDAMFTQLGSVVNGPIISQLSTIQAGTINTPCGAQPDTNAFTNSTLIYDGLNGTIARNAEVEIFWDGAGVLRFVFPTSPVANPAVNFVQGERFRFGARVANVSTGTGNNDGDGIGRIAAQATVSFHDGTALITPTSMGTFVDTTQPAIFGSKPELNFADCNNRPFVLPPRNIPAASNDNQSYALIDGGSANGNPFAVRVKLRNSVPSVCGNLFGLSAGAFSVQAETFAFYDCATKEVKLIRVSQFICN
ncbi:MAG: pilus assembly protein TadG-related protein [bacterium]|nr:pilus assembly protein TadG-related protein [bacterium]